jgi:hypothetical protein
VEDIAFALSVGVEGILAKSICSNGVFLDPLDAFFFVTGVFGKANEKLIGLFFVLFGNFIHCGEVLVLILD